MTSSAFQQILWQEELLVRLTIRFKVLGPFFFQIRVKLAIMFTIFIYAKRVKGCC